MGHLTSTRRRWRAQRRGCRKACSRWTQQGMKGRASMRSCGALLGRATLRVCKCITLNPSNAILHTRVKVWVELVALLQV